MLLGILLASSVSVFADEKINSSQTALSNTTISGSVNTSGQWNAETQQIDGFRVWWGNFIRWFRHH
jgi:hypothetical protein